MRNAPTLIVIFLSLLFACGDAGDSCPGDADASASVDVSVPGAAIVKVRAAPPRGFFAMAEVLQPLAEPTRPQRRLLAFADGASIAAEYVAPPGWSLLDFAVHPAGEVSAVLGTDTAVRLVRLSALLAVLGDAELLDPLAQNDPFMGNELVVRNPRSLLPYPTRDAARVGALGEDIGLVLRTGRQAVVAYRLSLSATSLTTLWRTVVGLACRSAASF
jgi:hypothetical protein